jgi:hypothetical protein
MHAGDALGSMGGQGLDAILRVSRRSDITTSCRAEVARVISGIPDPRAAMELALLRNDPSEYVRGAAQQHAGNMPPELQEAAEVKCGWLSTLMLCMRKDVLGSDKQALREQAAEGVGREGEDGARMLARLIEDLLHSRSGEIAGRRSRRAAGQPPSPRQVGPLRAGDHGYAQRSVGGWDRPPCPGDRQRNIGRPLARIELRALAIGESLLWHRFPGAGRFLPSPIRRVDEGAASRAASNRAVAARRRE